MKRRTAAAALLALPACALRAQAPETLRLVTGFAPGGATDRVARIVGDKLRQRFLPSAALAFPELASFEPIFTDPAASLDPKKAKDLSK